MSNFNKTWKEEAFSYMLKNASKFMPLSRAERAKLLREWIKAQPWCDGEEIATYVINDVWAEVSRTVALNARLAVKNVDTGPEATAMRYVTDMVFAAVGRPRKEKEECLLS